MPLTKEKALERTSFQLCPSRGDEERTRESTRSEVLST